jgi:hypothetical protein
VISVTRITIRIGIAPVSTTLLKYAVKLRLTVGATISQPTTVEVIRIAFVARQAIVIGFLPFPLAIRPCASPQCAWRSAREELPIVSPVVTAVLGHDAGMQKT